MAKRCVDNTTLYHETAPICIAIKKRRAKEFPKARTGGSGHFRWAREGTFATENRGDCDLCQKNPRAHKNKIGTSPPPPKTQSTHPPLKRGILWTWLFPQNGRIFQASKKWRSHFRPQNCGQKFYGHEDFSDCVREMTIKIIFETSSQKGGRQGVRKDGQQGTHPKILLSA